MRKLLALLTASAVLLLGGTALAATADLKVTKIVTNVATAQSGERVVFRAYARNRGPGVSQLDVSYVDATDIAIKREVCVVPPSESGDIIRPSADTPSCEFSDVPARDFVIVRVVAVVTGTAGGHAQLTFCTSNETGLPDPDPDNDCQTADIPITS